MLPRLFRTATFRLTLSAVPLLLLTGWGVLIFVYVNTEAIMERRVNHALRAEEHRLRETLAGHDDETTALAIRDLILGERGSSRLYRLADRTGTVLEANVEIASVQIPDAGRLVAATVTRLPDRTASSARLLAMALPGGMFLVLGRDLTEEDQFRLVVEETLGIGGALGVVLAILSGAGISRAVLRRLGEFNATAQRLLHGNLKDRMPLRGTNDEFDQLGRGLNEALDRIADLMDATRQVTDNIAHDLRGPLSRVRGRLEYLAVAEADGATVRDAIEESIADLDGILDAFEALLTIARLDNGVRADFEPVALTPLLEDLVDYYQPLAEEKGLTVDLAVEAEAVVVPANPHLLFQALSNLVDNAVRHVPAGGHIRIVLGRAAGCATVSVADDGPGIPPDRRAEVLKRFVRLDASRHQPGTGLGLAVVDAIVRHHHAELELADNVPGLRATLVMALAPDNWPAST